MSASTHPAETPSDRPPWPWFLAVGIALVLLGAIALGCPTVLEVSSVLILGPVLLANSVCQVLLAFFSHQARAQWMHLGSGALSLVVGFLVMTHPAEAAGDLALLLTAFLMVDGLNRVFGSRLMPFPARGWVLAAGALALALGLGAWAQAPARGLVLISLCVAVDFLFHGASWIVLSLAVRGTVDSPIPEPEKVPAREAPLSPAEHS
jgi:uncharacterized membrane protein HdeD (DUF308 family)